jgi:hypothetical protein
MRDFHESAQAYAAFAADCWRAGLGAAVPLAGVFAEHYRRLLAPVMPAEAVAATAVPALAAAATRCQRAAQALAALANGVATDAARRLTAELARTDAAPITTLRELHDLWVECGEQAWSAAVHQDAFGDAQSEWLASLVELHFEQQRVRRAAGGAPQ